MSDSPATMPAKSGIRATDVILFISAGFFAGFALGSLAEHFLPRYVSFATQTLSVLLTLLATFKMWMDQRSAGGKSEISN